MINITQLPMDIAGPVIYDMHCNLDLNARMIIDTQKLPTDMRTVFIVKDEDGNLNVKDRMGSKYDVMWVAQFNDSDSMEVIANNMRIGCVQSVMGETTIYAREVKTHKLTNYPAYMLLMGIILGSYLRYKAIEKQMGLRIRPSSRVMPEYQPRTLKHTGDK